MRIADRATTHFRKLAGQSKPVVEVPEWPDDAGAPTKLAFLRKTMDMDNRIIRVTQEEGPVAAMVESLILRAVDPDTGKKAFARAEKHELMNFVDPDVIAKIFMKLRDIQGDDQSVEEIEQD